MLLGVSVRCIRGRSEDVCVGKITGRLDTLGVNCVGYISGTSKDVCVGKITSRPDRLGGVCVCCNIGRSKEVGVGSIRGRSEDDSIGNITCRLHRLCGV